MFTLTAEASHLAREAFFPHGLTSGMPPVVEWKEPGAEAYLAAYKRRPYRTEMVPVLDRSRYVLEYHHGERSCCTLHPVIHDTPMSFVLSYEDIAIGLVGFDVEAREDYARVLFVGQIQGTRYRTIHSGRDTGAEGPARSVSWQPALLNLVVAFAPLAGAAEVLVRPHSRSMYGKIRHNVRGNAERLYDGTARDCGFCYDARREVWARAVEPDAALAAAEEAAVFTGAAGRPT